MLKQVIVAFVVTVVVAITPMRLPAASCILSNAPSHEACKSGCCANMTCCVVSKENTGPASQSLLQSAAAKQQVLGVVGTPAIRLQVQPLAAGPIACAGAPTRAHSPPPLAASCIRLI